MGKKVLIVGAGPAGLTAALELVRRSEHQPLVVEALEMVGGLARTEIHNGNRMDIGGHRFFSKSDWVMDWWRRILPPPAEGSPVGYVPEEERTLLLRPRLSRIYFLRRFFDYPVSLSAGTMKNLGLLRLGRIGLSYLWTRAFPRHPERNLEDFFVNRFGGELYRTFFKDYTEKVWGVPCTEISPEWGAQRIKGLSVLKALKHAAGQLLKRSSGEIAQKGVETSLIERFLYPKLGPGQMWQVVAEQVQAGGGDIRFGKSARKFHLEHGRITAVELEDLKTGCLERIDCDAVISTMPLRDLVAGMEPAPDKEVRRVADGLMYRDFLTVGLLVRKLKANGHVVTDARTNLVPDNWIYIQEPDVRIGRLQVFNNWSPALVKAPEETVWLGLEYFCQEGDDLWSRDDGDLGRFAIGELEKIGLIDAADALEFKVVRAPKAYPAYFGTYDEFAVLRQWADDIPNLYPVGRNGMHRYNNQDHSMLTARMAVDHILGESLSKTDIWSVNTEEQYHEEKPSE